MASAGVQIDAGGAELLAPDGATVIADDGDPCGCLCITIIPPCGTNNTCGKFCDATKAGSSRAPQCRCPCPGGKDFPPGYKYTATGFVVGSSHVAGTGPSAQTYVLTGSGGPFGMSSCDGRTSDHLGSVAWNHYDADGNFIDSGTSEVRGVIDPYNLIKTGDCDHGSVHTIYPTAQFSCLVGGSCPTAASINYLPSTGGNAFDSGADRCDGGSVGALHIDIGNVASPGSMSAKPTCEDCDGNPLDPGGDDRTTCCHHIQVVVRFYAGKDLGGADVYDEKTFDITGGPSSYTGTDEDGDNGGIDNSADNPTDATDHTCCPGADCDDVCVSPTGCNGCWTGEFQSTLALGGGGVTVRTLKFFGTGTCASVDLLYDHTGFDDLPAPDGAYGSIAGLGCVGDDCP